MNNTDQHPARRNLAWHPLVRQARHESWNHHMLMAAAGRAESTTTD